MPAVEFGNGLVANAKLCLSAQLRNDYDPGMLAVAQAKISTHMLPISFFGTDAVRLSTDLAAEVAAVQQSAAPRPAAGRRTGPTV